MNLYLLTATEKWRRTRGPESLVYTRAIVAARDEETARFLYPGDLEPGWTVWNSDAGAWDDGIGGPETDWPAPEDVRIRLLAEDVDIPDGVLVAT